MLISQSITPYQTLRWLVDGVDLVQRSAPQESEGGDHKLSADALSLSNQGWDEFSRLARVEGVGPWLHWHLKRQGLASSFPAPVRSALASAYYQSAAHNQVLSTELRRITTAFRQACIPLQPLKGAALAGVLYPDPSLRPMNDLDLLIKPADLERSLALLGQLGYQLQKITYHAVLSRGTKGEIPLELHWCLPDGQAVPETWWVGAMGTGSEIPSPRLPGPFGPLEHLLFLSAHLLLQHGDWLRLIWLMDLRLLLEQISEKEISRAFEIAHSLGWGNLLHTVLETIRQPLLGGPAPQNPELEISHFQAIQNGNAWRLRRAWVLLDWRGKVLLLAGLLFPAPRYLRWKYNPQPEWLWPVFYLRRWAQSWRGR